jgi:hypothetical protein
MTDYRIFVAGDVVLQSGLTYRGARIAYKTYGTLDAEKDRTLRGDLTAKGMTFRDIDKAEFRAALAKTSYYKDWKGKYGEETRGQLEAVVGHLA